MVHNYDRPMHEITFSTDDKPKLLSQVVGCAFSFDLLFCLIEMYNPAGIEVEGKLSFGFDS